MNTNPGSRFVPLEINAFRALLETEMGFEQRQPEGTRELCWERRVVTKAKNFPYLIRIYSTIEPNGHCRDLGADAIRVVLVDAEGDHERQLSVEKRVFRTKSAMPNLRARARDLWRYVMTPEHQCPRCGRLLVVKKAHRGTTPGGEFFGCVGYAHKACSYSTSRIPETAR